MVVVTRMIDEQSKIFDMQVQELLLDIPSACFYDLELFEDGSISFFKECCTTLTVFFGDMEFDLGLCQINFPSRWGLLCNKFSLTSIPAFSTPPCTKKY